MSEPSPLLELLENTGLFNRAGVNERRALKLSAGQISDLGSQAAAITKPEQYSVAAGTLTHTATISLGGGTEPCIGIDCRLRHIDELVPFAALYSDRVYIHNFLSNHEHVVESGYVPSLEERRLTLVDDLQVLQRVRPLIEAGLIVPVTSTDEVCSQCIARGAFGAEADKRFLTEQRRLAERFFENMSITVERGEDGWEFHCTGPADLFEHGERHFTYEEPPEALYQLPQVLERTAMGESVQLSQTDKRVLGEHESAASDVFGSVVFEMAVAQVLGASYLSDTELPIEILTAISGDSDLARRNSLVQKHLTSIVPFLGDVSAEVAIKLRQSEEESFLIYRQALNKAIDDVRAQRTAFTERDARAIYSDVVAPGLARLDRAVKSARGGLIKQSANSIVGWSAAISFGMYTGLLPPQLALAAKAIGLTKVLGDIGGKMGKLFSTDDAIQKDDLFFLWKVRNASRQDAQAHRPSVIG